MATRPPTITRILIAVGFALSCFGLALFLWLAFGGPVPLKPEGYQVVVPFDEATQLAVESDVRISGVSVGKVKEIELGDGNRAEATVELDDRYAPIPSDSRATLRSKTLLGETYVELTPGSDKDDPLREGGRLPAAQVTDSVQLDEIFRTFDQPTRVAFQQWMQNASIALEGRGDDLSAGFAELDPFSEELNNVLRILDSQRLAVRELLDNGGQVFHALSERRGQLRGLIQNSNEVFSTTAQRNQELEEIFKAFPTFLDESRLTVERLAQFADDTDPLVQQLRPGVRELSPTLVDLARLSPHLESFFGGLRDAIDEAPSGFGALQRLLADDLRPLLARMPSFLNELDPLLTVLGNYKHELTALFGNAASATNGSTIAGGTAAKYLRTETPLNPETLASFPERLTTQRTNPYVKPGGYRNLETFLRSFETRHCDGGGITATIAPGVPSDPDFLSRVNGDAAEAQDFYDRLLNYALRDETPADGADTASVPAPPCVAQEDYKSIGDRNPERTKYLHVYRHGTP